MQQNLTTKINVLNIKLVPLNPIDGEKQYAILLLIDLETNGLYAEISLRIERNYVRFSGASNFDGYSDHNVFIEGNLEDLERKYSLHIMDIIGNLNKNQIERLGDYFQTLDNLKSFFETKNSFFDDNLLVFLAYFSSVLPTEHPLSIFFHYLSKKEITVTLKEAILLTEKTCETGHFFSSGEIKKLINFYSVVGTTQRL